jgi:hypothetical protein
MTMAAVRAEDQIFYPQMGTHSNRDGLLSHIQVHKSRKPAIAIQFLNFELEESEFEHLFVIGKK